MLIRGFNKYLLMNEAGEDQGGGGDENQNQNQDENEQKVDYKTYETTKNDMHKFKRENQELKSKLEELTGEISSIKTKQLESKENYKELWEQEKGLRSKTEEKYKSLSQNIVHNERMNAIKDQAVKSGINPEFMDMLDAFDTSEVIVETTSSGRFNVSGADTFIEALKSSKPTMFTKQNQDPNINNKGGSFKGGEKTYTTSEILELEKKDPEKYREIVTKKRHLIVKK